MPTNTFWLASTANFTQTTLNGAITSGALTITLNSITGIQAPGYAIIDRTDSNGNSTPANREVITYTGISGSQLTGVTRTADQSTARSHADAAVVEISPTAGMWNSLTSIVSMGLDTQGLLKAIVSPVTINYSHLIQADLTSIASIAQANIVNLQVSGASISGLGFSPAFIGAGAYSGPTVAIGGILIAPRGGVLQWVSAVTRYVASGTSVGFDFQLRNASVFANATTRPAIAAAGTFVSTASIATTNINAGDLIQANVDSLLSGAGLIREITVQAGII